MHLRVLLIVGFLIQAITVQRACVVIGCAGQTGGAVEFACCPCDGATGCVERAPGTPCDEPGEDEGLCCCCCLCVGLRDAPGVLVAKDREASATSVACLWTEPFYPILATERVGPVPATTSPAPPGASLRRACLCCWTI